MGERLRLVLVGIAILAGAVVWRTRASTPTDAPVAVPAEPPSVRSEEVVTVGDRPTDSPHVENPPVPVPDTEETWEILALDRAGRPLEGVVVGRDPGGSLPYGDPVSESGRDGRLTLRVPRGAETVRVWLGGVVWDTRDLSGQRTVVRFDDALPVEVRVVDARDGSTVKGARVAVARGAATPLAVASDGDVHLLTASPSSLRLQVSAGDAFAVAGDIHTTPTRRRFEVAARARSACVTIPVWPAGRVTVRVVDASDAPAAESVEATVRVGMEAVRSGRFPLDAESRAVIDGVPIVPDATLQVEVTKGGLSGWVRGGTLRAGTTGYEVNAVLLGEATAPGMRFGGGTVSCGFAPGRIRRPGTASLSVRVLRQDGAPAANARVRVTRWRTDDRSPVASPRPWEEFIRTDASGIAVLDGIPTDEQPLEAAGPPGTVTVDLLETGLVPTSRMFELTAGKRTSCELREAEGLATELTVVDREGRPVPWVRVTAHLADDESSDHWTWTTLDGDVQDVSPLTGLDGRLTLRGLPAGEIVIEAEFGDRTSGTFTAGEPALLSLTR